MKQRFEKNTKGTDYAIGDIHGNFTGLMEKLASIGFNFNHDRLFSVGDLVDRGLNSEKCLNLLKENWFFSVRGNHEQLMIESVKRRDGSATSCWMTNGGSWATFLEEDEIFELAELADSMPWWMEVDTSAGLVGIIHAESKQDWLENQDIDEDLFLWARNKIKTGNIDAVDNIYRVIVGHTPIDEPKKLGNVIYIDTAGWHPKGKFTVINLLTMETA